MADLSDGSGALAAAKLMQHGHGGGTSSSAAAQQLQQQGNKRLLSALESWIEDLKIPLDAFELLYRYTISIWHLLYM